MKLLVNIKQLVQVRTQDERLLHGTDMNRLPLLSEAWLAVRDGIIEDFGEMHTLDNRRFAAYERIDLSGKTVLPTWVDSHTHLVFADWREQEFTDRISGLTYEQIAERGGGILNSAEKTEKATEDELFWSALQRLAAFIRMGTGAIEIKSGYGLSLESELKMLRVIARLKEVSPIPVKATFLGAHAFPMLYKHRQDAYVNLVVNEMLPAIAAEGLADYIDVFCEKGYFNVEQTCRIMDAGTQYGLKAKVHVNQFNAIGGIQACVERGALTVDHLEIVEPDDIRAMLSGHTIPVALPSCSFFLGLPYTPARQIIDAGLPLALASDFNPGSSPSGNMNFVVSLGCIKMRMTPHEAINAATLNAAACMEAGNAVGSITPGKRANFIVTTAIPSLDFIPYSFGQSCIDKVYINGEAFNALG